MNDRWLEFGSSNNTEALQLFLFAVGWDVSGQQMQLLANNLPKALNAVNTTIIRFYKAGSTIDLR